MRLFARNASPDHGDVELADAVIGNLEGAAARWAAQWQDEAGNLQIEASELFTRLLDQFRPIDVAIRAENTLETLSQQGSVEDYVTTFEGVMVDVPNLSDAERRRTFLRGLKARIRGAVKKAEPASYEEARRLALHEDRNYDGHAMARTTPVGRQPDTSVEIEAFQAPPGQTGPWQGTQPTRGAARCYSCGRPGHYARNCTQRGPAQPYQ
ncbi:hypothetical protein H4R19_004721 [Coemansia spiralis]|nr:hypothetical protein H4R19_004721 [Coemansia spiralis]